MKKLIIASTSTIHGSGYLEYLLPILSTHFTNVKNMLFIPYARPSGISYDEYTAKARAAFNTINIDVKGIHEFENPKEAILNAEAIFTGGGNTFELVNQLYKQAIFDILQEVVENGTPYLGTSAGSNICGVSMMNTNDMPIVYPPSFKTLAFRYFHSQYLFVSKKPIFLRNSSILIVKLFKNQYALNISYNLMALQDSS